MNALLAFGAAALWGSGDFAGGMGVRAEGGGMAAALRFVFVSHGVALCLLLCLALVRGDAPPHGAALAWALGAGISGGLAVAVFYVALSRGAMGASAAVSGLLAAALPVLLSADIEGVPGMHRVVGFLIVGLAIWLIGAAPTEHGAHRTMSLAVLSGAGFGVFFIALRFAGAAGVVWPMATARLASTTFCGVVLLSWPKTQPLARLTRGTLRYALAAAVLDAGGNMLFVASTRVGRLDVAAVLGSLYPAMTIFLAALNLGEAPTRRQGMGMIVALAAVLLISF